VGFRLSDPDPLDRRIRGIIGMRASAEWTARWAATIILGTPVALYTPPVAGTLFVAAKLAQAGIGDITGPLWPLLIAAVGALFVITCVPSLTTVVWRHVN